MVGQISPKGSLFVRVTKYMIQSVWIIQGQSVWLSHDAGNLSTKMRLYVGESKPEN